MEKKLINLVIASKNIGKIKEIKEILSDLQLKLFSYRNFPNLSAVIEDGKTFKENALKKATTMANSVNMLSLADDSGLEVEALNGKPGIHSSRFAGENASDLENNIKLLNLLKNIPEKQRVARFRCVMVLANPLGEINIVEGVCDGFISNKLSGQNGFGYDPLFIVPKYGKTFAELDISIKNEISHRAIALRKMKKIIEKL